MVADGRRCYLGEFYSPISSYIAPVPTIQPEGLEMSPKSPLRISIPVAGAKDPRGDPRLRKALAELEKLKGPATRPVADSGEPAR